MRYLGDFAEDETVKFRWNTNNKDGASVTRTTDGTITIYRSDGTTSTAGLTDDEDTPATGIHTLTIDTSAAAFYATGYDYDVVLTGAVIDSETINAVLAHFSIENREFSIRGSSGLGATTVDHNFGGTDNLRYIDGAGQGIDNAEILIYLKSDYDAGNISSNYVKAKTNTDVNGRWANPVNLDPATYTVYCYKQGEFGPDTQEITVT